MIFVVILLGWYNIRIEMISPDVVAWCYFSAAVSDSGPIQAVREVKVVDIGVNSFTLSWRKTPGASGYKISWIPFLGKGPHIQSTMCAYTGVPMLAQINVHLKNCLLLNVLFPHSVLID